MPTLPIVLADLHPESLAGRELTASLKPAFHALRARAKSGSDLTADELLERLEASGAVALVLASPTALRPLAKLVKALRRGASGVPLLAATDSGEPDVMMELLRFGIDDFVTAPFRAGDVQPRLWRLLASQEAHEPRIEAPAPRRKLRALVGASPAFRQVIEQAELYARSNSTVLLTGETGTGKEVISRAIHASSQRARKPFVPVNCGAIPVELVENELFGHERSAYTGAATACAGLIAEAEGGTILLDEIDALPLSAQVKLLRFLQEKEYRALGSPRTRKADVRVIAATNARVENAVEDGRLRRDLYYRLNVLPLTLPPLRRRREDIPLLVRHFLQQNADPLGGAAPSISPPALWALLEHRWPGNVRELRHVIERAVVLAQGRRIVQPAHLWPTAGELPEPRSFKEAKARVVDSFERAYIEKLLTAYQGNVTRASQAAHKHRRALSELIRKHHIDVDRYRTPAVRQ